MPQTIKELIETAKEYFVNDGVIEITNSIQIINTLTNILQAHENELAKKDKEINSLK